MRIIEEECMKKKIILTTLILGMAVTACESKNAEALENANPTLNSSVENTSEREDSQEVAEADASLEKEDDEKVSEAFDSKTIELDVEENDYSKAITESIEDGCKLASFVVDMDADEKSEAFVIEGYEEGPDTLDYDESIEYWYVQKLWFVDENCNVSEIEDYKGSHIATTQQILENDENSFVIINGYIGVDGIGNVYSVSDDSLKIVTPELRMYGQKKFSGSNELIWYAEDYRAFYPITDGCTPLEVGGSGRCYLPYHLKLDNGEFKLYGAKEVSVDDVKAIADIDFGEEIDLSTAQFILRDNNELDVNYFDKDKYDYNFHCAIYFINKNKDAWELSETIDGYVNLCIGENDWAVLSENMNS